MAQAAAHSKKFRVKKGDTVEVVQGKEVGKRGKVLRVLAAEERVVVECVHGGPMNWTRECALPGGNNKNAPGGRINGRAVNPGNGPRGNAARQATQSLRGPLLPWFGKAT